MSDRTDPEIEQAIAAAAAEYEAEDRAAAEEELREEAASRVFSVRLSPGVYSAVRDAAERAHLTPSALIRQWISERAEDTGQDDLAGTVAALRRDVERLAKFAPPA